MEAMPSPAAVDLTDAVRAFLAQPLIATIASLDEDGAPRQAAVWYRLDDDGRVLLNSRAGRRWCENLERDGRVSIAVIDPEDGYRWIGLVGEVEVVVTEVERSREDIVALAHRYHPEGPSESSIALFRRQPRVTFLVRITGVHDHLEDD
jgi:PPOX class probable F420-dependent enzyme